MNPRALLFGSLLAAAVSWQTHTVAKPAGDSGSDADRDRAIQLFQEGQKEYDAGQYGDALEKFREVDSVLTSPNARLYMARCLRELGRLNEAFELMTDTVATANKKAATDENYLRTRDAAAAEREAIVPKIGRVVIATSNPPDDLVVKVDARELSASDFGRELGVDPGGLIVTAEADGYEPFRHVAQLEAGEKTTVAVSMVLVGQGGGGTGGATEPGGDGWRTAGFVTMSVGVLGMGMFVITGLMANDRYATLEDECVQAPCGDPKYQDVVDEGKTLDLLANVGLGVGIAGLVAGTLMVALGWPSEPEPTTDSEDGEAEESGELEQSATVEASPWGAFVGYQLQF